MIPADIAIIAAEPNNSAHTNLTPPGSLAAPELRLRFTTRMKA